jgi:hypothetical protein
MERYIRVNLLGPGPCLIKKRIYRAAVSQRLRNTVLDKQHICFGTKWLFIQFWIYRVIHRKDSVWKMGPAL